MALMEDNVIMDLKEIGVNTRIWVGLTEVMIYWSVLLNAALNLRVLCAEELVIHFLI